MSGRRRQQNVSGGRGRPVVGRAAPRLAGIITTEVVTALALTGTLLAVMSALVVSHRRANDHYVLHHRAQLAAESYVEHLRAGCPPPSADGVSYEVERDAGRDEWAGLTRLAITAVVQGRSGRSARCTVTTFVREDRP